MMKMRSNFPADMARPLCPALGFALGKATTACTAIKKTKMAIVHFMVGGMNGSRKFQQAPRQPSISLALLQATLGEKREVRAREKVGRRKRPAVTLLSLAVDLQLGLFRSSFWKRKCWQVRPLSKQHGRVGFGFESVHLWTVYDTLVGAERPVPPDGDHFLCSYYLPVRFCQ